MVLTENFVFHETVQGPFQPNDTEYAPWAPREQDVADVAAYQKTLTDVIEQGLRPDCALRTATL